MSSSEEEKGREIELNQNGENLPLYEGTRGEGMHLTSVGNGFEGIRNCGFYAIIIVKLSAQGALWFRGSCENHCLLLHDNARPQSAQKSQRDLSKFKWQIFDHPPYSPDLAQSDFNMFPQLNVHLGGKKFDNNDEILMCGIRGEKSVFAIWARYGTTVVYKNSCNATKNVWTDKWLCGDVAEELWSVYTNFEVNKLC